MRRQPPHCDQLGPSLRRYRAAQLDRLAELSLEAGGYAASGMEAPSGGETTKIGSTEGDSPTSQSEGTPKSHPLSSGDEV